MVPLSISDDFQELYIIEKDENGKIIEIPKFTVAFVPLTDRSSQWSDDK